MSWAQKCVALSTTEAKYVAITESCKEAIWLDHLEGDLGIHTSVPTLHSVLMSAI